MKSAEYEKPRNSSCICCVRTKSELVTEPLEFASLIISNLPDWTGVNTGVTLVNSESKLLVSVADLICGKNGGGILLW